MNDGLPVVDEIICIGCGVCLLHCPTDAAKLKKRDEDSFPFKDFVTLHRTEIREAVSQKTV
jgi:Na+-translocating ferredoxin:NAD+ oxidoreductase RNF subunit RnfB